MKIIYGLTYETYSIILRLMISKLVFESGKIFRETEKAKNKKRKHEKLIIKLFQANQKSY